MASVKWRGIAFTSPIIAQYHALIEPAYGDDACWFWIGSRNEAGYGSFKGVGSHIIAVVLDGRPIPDGYHVHHKCRNPTCCRPEHLDVLSPSEHKAADCALRRLPPQPKPQYEPRYVPIPADEWGA